MNAAPAIPGDVVALCDYERHARERLPEAAWAYLNGGAADEHTLRANQSAWAHLQLYPRVLRTLAGGHTRSQLLGRTLAWPVLLAPVAYQKMVHPDGELATAYAAAAQQTGLVLSTQASMSLEHIAHAIHGDPDRGPLWLQLYIQHDRGFTLELVRRAEAAGYEALVVTVDAPTSGARDRERRAHFQVPEGIQAVNLAGLKPAPTRLLQPGGSALFDDVLHDAPTWDDIAWLQAQTHLPVILKGVLHPADARQALSLHVDALIVSNHGGRTLDTVPATAQVLPRIVDAVGQDLPVLVDGGIRRGTDVLKALALGARAALVGRPYVHALATAGALGVAHAVRLLRDEFEIAMALAGCATLADITPDVLFD